MNSSVYPQALLSWEKEERTQKWFGFQDGMPVLELGYGPGFIAEQLLELFPHCPITAMDINPVIIQKAQEYLIAKDGNQMGFVEASITDSGLPGNRFDFAIARLILQHNLDPFLAAKDLLRVLKPGGRFVILDSAVAIWGLTDPIIPELELIIEKYGQAQADRRVNRFIDPRFWHILEGSGFIEMELDAVILHSTDLGAEAFLSQLDPDR